MYNHQVRLFTPCAHLLSYLLDFNLTTLYGQFYISLPRFYGREDPTILLN